MKSRNMIKSSPSRKVFVCLNTLFFFLITFACFYPLWYVLIQSLSDSKKAVNAIILPISFTFQNYIEVFKIPEIYHAIMISVLRTVIGGAGTVICCMLAGYLFTKENVPCKKVFYRMLVITMYASGGLIPTYLAFNIYGLSNSFLVYIVPHLISAYNVILIKTFVEQLPKEMEESARMDGATTMRVFFSIILPLSLPIAATIAIYATNTQWNSWFDNQLYTVTNPNLTTLQFLLYNFLNKSEQLIAELEKNDNDAALEKLLTPRGIKMTVTMISTIPIFLVYPFMQRYLIKGIMIGAVKG